jgi:hypothetical protein
MSAGLPPIADIARRGWHGRKVPQGDICSAAKDDLYSITTSVAASE